MRSVQPDSYSEPNFFIVNGLKQKQPPEVFYKKSCYVPCSGLGPATLLRKRL